MILSISDLSYNDPLRRLFSRNLQFDKLLGGSALPLLTTLVMPLMVSADNKLNIKQLKSFSGLGMSTVQRTLKNLVEAGAVYLKDRKYGMSRSLVDLSDFVTQYSLHIGSKIIQQLVQNSVGGVDSIGSAQVLKHFQAGGELIFSVPHEVELVDDPRVTPTSFTTFLSEGLEFRTARKYYHYSMGCRELQKEDAAIDHLLLDPHSIQNVAYSMLYLKSLSDGVNWSYLFEVGQPFNTADLLEKMKRFLDALPEVEPAITKPFPSTKEFKDLCVLYGVKY